MSEDRSSSGQRSWLEKITQAFAHEPRSREELLELLREAQRNKLIDSEALSIVEGAIQVADLQVRDIMVPRSQMVSIKACQSPREFLPAILDAAHSRYPVIGESQDEVLGILLAKDLLPLVLQAPDQPFNLRELLRPAVLIPESKKLNLLLKEFRLSRNHMAIVVDEYGGVAGLVTIEDVLEQIVGEIDDEHDDAEDPNALIAAQADGQFVVDALTPISDFNERFGADFADDEYDTIGGLVTAAIGHLPEAGEELTLGRFGFRVARADARRLHALHVGVHADG